MKLLAIDTATEACSAALSIAGETLVRYEIAPRRHTKLILSMCEQLLDQAGVTLSQLDVIAFGRGPGSFTGVRIAAAVTQGMAFARDLPVAPISTLAGLAQEVMEVWNQPKVLAAIDARMNEVYWGYYTRDPDDLASVLGDEGVSKPALLPLLTGKWYGAGSGWKTYSDSMIRRIGADLQGYEGSLLPKAQYLIPLAMAMYQRGEVVSAELALPVYLRNKVADKSR